MSSWPARTRIRSLRVLPFAVPTPPESFLHVVQWQNVIFSKPGTSNRTAPQWQLPWSMLETLEQLPNRLECVRPLLRLRVDRLEVARSRERDQLGLVAGGLGVGDALRVGHVGVGVAVNQDLADTERSQLEGRGGRVALVDLGGQPAH